MVEGCYLECERGLVASEGRWSLRKRFELCLGKKKEKKKREMRVGWDILTIRGRHSLVSNVSLEHRS